MLWWKDGDWRHSHSILPIVSVQLHSRTLVCNLVYQSMGESRYGASGKCHCSATCERLQRKVSNKFRCSQIEMGWLEDNFKTIEALASDIQKEKSTRAFILSPEGLKTLNPRFALGLIILPMNSFLLDEVLLLKGLKLVNPLVQLFCPGFQGLVFGLPAGDKL
ncbi:hypothetical protein J1N35_022510 [Gossypium stocksii]|uniref:Uncharacterized protein n=1 Tax=Gossypium stocksii TaxID=47602 RepID=A0A9D4A3J0_9ROSI|nr:hypothetical protein J1N35_022510 [Gossypium stocksii]